MKILASEIAVGADAPFTLLHMSDVHLTFADGRDDGRKLELARSRAGYFRQAEEYLALAAETARRENALIVCTGDLIDFVSEANIDAARSFTDVSDCFFTAGNHEFSLYVGEEFEDEAYRNRSLAKVQAAFGNDIRFASRVINGVNLVALDNSYYHIDRAQLDALKAECGRGMPVILLMHVPLYAPDICDIMLNVKGEPCAHLINTPDGIVDGYTPDRIRQQRTDGLTREACEYIASQPAIKAVIAGHVHTHCESRVSEGLTQYIAGVDSMRLIRVK